MCRRGKREQKWFTIYICESDSAAKDFKVKLSPEHLDAQWMPFKEVKELSGTTCTTLFHNVISIYMKMLI